MTRLDITKATRLEYQRQTFRMVARREEYIDWTCDRNGQSHTFTDAEIVSLIVGDLAAARQHVAERVGAAAEAKATDPATVAKDETALGDAVANGGTAKDARHTRKPLRRTSIIT